MPAVTLDCPNKCGFPFVETAISTAGDMPYLRIAIYFETWDDHGSMGETVYWPDKPEEFDPNEIVIRCTRCGAPAQVPGQCWKTRP